jgi:hypothetical protein
MLRRRTERGSTGSVALAFALFPGHHDSHHGLHFLGENLVVSAGHHRSRT